MMIAHKAVKLAMKLNQDDPEWSYVVKHVGLHGKVEVFDETGSYMGELTVMNNEVV